MDKPFHITQRAMPPTSLQFSNSIPPTIYTTNLTKTRQVTSFFSSSNNPIPLTSYSFLLSPKFISTSTASSSSSSSATRKALVKCSSEDREITGMKDLLSGMVNDQVEELLNRDENKGLLDGLEAATQRVDMARKELAEIERQEEEVARLKEYVGQLEGKTSEIAECQKELLEARAMVEQAELSLSMNMDGDRPGDALQSTGGQEIAERLESIKAASVSAVVGTLAGFPISISQTTDSASLLLHLGVIFISCALFGVTFRYTIRRDLDNIQLKTGTAGAFSFVKGLATLEAGQPLEFSTSSFLSHAIDGAVFVSQNLLIFVFASVGLDFCFKMGLLSPFPIRK